MFAQDGRDLPVLGVRPTLSFDTLSLGWIPLLMSYRDQRQRPQDDPLLQPGSRALAEYVLLFFAALGLILILASLLVSMLNGIYNDIGLGNQVLETPLP